MRLLDGHRAHMAHVQFHAYGGDDWHNLRSESTRLAEYLNTHPNLTADAGAILFGDAVTISADGPWQHLLHQLTGRKWGNLDVENETCCGVVPYVYKDRSLVNAVQWAVGLELLLQCDDPWRIFLTTDHPNGACFWRYPEIIHLLMNADLRRERIRKLPEKALSRIVLPQLDREYTLLEIATITSAGPARALGLAGKGHLGPGADGDVAIFNRDDDIERMFRYPRYVIKGGEVVVEEGEIRKTVDGHEFLARPSFDPAIADDLRPLFEEHYTRVDGQLSGGTGSHSRSGDLRVSMIRLTVKRQPEVPLEAEVLCPDMLAGLGYEAICALPVFLGRRQRRLDELFDVDGERSDQIEIHGNASRVKWIGRGMTWGSIRIVGSAGMHLGSAMRGGKIEVSGNAADWVGAEMSGGVIRIAGNAGSQIGAAYRGSRAGMTGGTILVEGSAGDEIGMRMRRGTIAVNGTVGDFAGLEMRGGTILVGSAGLRTGAWMTRGTILSLAPIELLPTFLYNCQYHPTFLRPLARHLAKWGYTLPCEERTGGYQLHSGDTAVSSKGEILIWKPAD